MRVVEAARVWAARDTPTLTTGGYTPTLGPLTEFTLSVRGSGGGACCCGGGGAGTTAATLGVTSFRDFTWYLGVLMTVGWCAVTGRMGREAVPVMAGPIMPCAPIIWIPWGVCTIV